VDAYYELEKGESPQDFELLCDCGGKLEYDPNKKSGPTLIIQTKLSAYFYMKIDV
jgi:hypothetical protein